MREERMFELQITSNIMSGPCKISQSDYSAHDARCNYILITHYNCYLSLRRDREDYLSDTYVYRSRFI